MRRTSSVAGQEQSTCPSDGAAYSQRQHVPTPRVQKYLCCNATKRTPEAKVAREIKPDIKAHRHMAYPNTAANYQCHPPDPTPPKTACACQPEPRPPPTAVPQGKWTLVHNDPRAQSTVGTCPPPPRPPSECIPITGRKARPSASKTEEARAQEKSATKTGDTPGH